MKHYVNRTLKTKIKYTLITTTYNINKSWHHSCFYGFHKELRQTTFRFACTLKHSYFSTGDNHDF